MTLIVGILETGDDLEDQVDRPGAGGVEGLEHLSGLDDAGRVVLLGERPVVVAEAVGLLQLHLGEAAAEALQPRVRIALRACGPGHAVMPDVEAEPPRDVLRRRRR